MNTVSRMLIKVAGYLLIALSVASGVQAEDKPGRAVQVAVVNVGVLLESSPQSKAANEKLKTAFVSREEELNKEQQAIQQEEADMAVKIESGSISEEDKLQQQRELRDRKRKNTRALEDFREEVRTARDLAVDNLQTQIVQAIGKVREREQIDVVLRETDYIVASDRIDITPKVMQYLVESFQAEQAQGSKPDAKGKE